ncbi:MAG: Smr/MutS family protein [Patescibacteria group bacterium]|jgi:DNA-nicking Smr family endonuclease
MKFRQIPKIEMPLPEKSDPIETELFAAELSEDTPEVDLHDLTPQLALDTLGSFLHQEFSGASRRDVKVVKVIHGRGTGIMRDKVEKFLKTLRFVERFRTSQKPGEVNGALLVVLAPNRK